MTLDVRERKPARSTSALLQALELTVARRMEGLLSGDYRSHVLGRGGELAQIRPYDPEIDDVRQIDWKATARTGVPHVRVQVAERVLVTWIVVDASPSMTFGTVMQTKLEVAEGAAFALGYAATRRGNRLGTVVFGNEGMVSRPPRAGHAGVTGLALGFRGEGLQMPGQDTLGAAIGRTNRIARPWSLVVLVSDFRGPPDWRRPLLQLAGRHEVIAVEVRDPREQELADVGELRLVDPETNRQLRVNTSDPALRRRFASAAAAERRVVASMLASAGVRHVVLDNAGDWLHQLTRFLRAGPASR